MVTFDNSMEGHTITIDGTRRSILAFEKILGVFDGKLSIKGTDIDSSSVDDDGWEAPPPDQDASRSHQDCITMMGKSRLRRLPPNIYGNSILS